MKRYCQSKCNKQLLTMAQIAKMAQLPREDQKNFLRKDMHFNYRDHTLSYYEQEGTELCTLSTNDGKLYISFRGTEMHHTDIIPHAMRWSVSTEVGRIHAGYWQKVLSVWAFVCTKIEECHMHYRGTGKFFWNNSITVVGHSLGGALAQITYLKILKEYPQVDTTCITFGSCKPFRDQMHIANHDVYNYYLMKDFVGLFPHGYHVLTKPIILNKNNGYAKDRIIGVGLIKALYSMFVTKRHAIDTYINYIKELP